MGKRKTLSYGEHLEIAARIKEARKLLMDIRIRVGNGLGTASKAGKISQRIFDKFDLDLRSELDNVAFRDCPDVDGDELKSLYYGPTTDSKVVLLRSRKDDK